MPISNMPGYHGIGGQKTLQVDNDAIKPKARPLMTMTSMIEVAIGAVPCMRNWLRIAVG